MFYRNSFRLYLDNRKLFGTLSVVERASKRKVLPEVTAENQYDVLSGVVTPWWHLDYTEQLLLKKKWSRSVVESMKARKLQKRCRTVIHNVLPSPVIESYRNKDEFSIRTGIDGNDKTVGFFIGSPAHGKVVCVPPTKLITLKEDHIYLSEVFQNLIRSSELRACHNLDDGGFWRNAVVRSNRKGEIMVIIIGNPNGASNEQIEEAKQQIKDHFLKTSCNITSLYFQPCPKVRCTADQAPYILLHGDSYLYENYNDLVIRISPDSFNQINTEAALVLYKRVLELLQVDSTTTLLDLCCGIGSVSLLSSKSVRGCIGIEYIGQAVKDAQFNAEYNQITNCHFITGRIEKELRKVLSELASDVAPVINPGRAGINRRVISLIRQSRSINRFVYIACKADGREAMNNFADFCSLSFDSSPAFSLTHVQGVDMFPQTSQTELILFFER